MKPVRTVGIVNGGGDAPGLNAVIRAVVRTAISRHGMRVIGIRNGFDGLIWPEGAKEMAEESVSGILPRGGTILGTTNRGNPFAYKTRENGVETAGFTLREILHKEIRVTVLGHVQRGGSPTPFDRILGTRLGVAATDLVAKHQSGRMVCLKSGKIESVSLDEALEKMKYVDPASEIVHAARSVGSTFGDSA